MNRLIIIIFLSLFILACGEKQQSIKTQKNSIVGLWVVEEVKVGEEIMTPNARWMRFNKDSTQQSGNGWLQHSIGIYSYNNTHKELRITNTNGYKDTYEPFKVKLQDEKMLWSRTEDSVNVTIVLKKTKKLPQSDGNKLLGVWSLVKITENGQDVTQLYNEEQKNYLYMRWDGKFIVNNSTAGKTRGIYNVHAHKPQVELIVSINDSLQKETWKFEATDSTVVFTNTPTKTKKYYKRILQFPE